MHETVVQSLDPENVNFICVKIKRLMHSNDPSLFKTLSVCGCMHMYTYDV